MYNSQEIAQQIKLVAKNKGISVNQLLQNCGLGKNTVAKMANGTDVLLLNLAKIADYLDCSVDYLLGRTDNPNLTGGTYINGNNNNNGNQAINGNININATEHDDFLLLEMIKKLDLVQRSKIIAKIDEMENENK